MSSQYLTATKCPCCDEILIVYARIINNVPETLTITKYDETIDGKRKISEIFQDLDNTIQQEGREYFKKLKE